MEDKIKTDIDRLLLVPKLKKSSILAKYIEKFVFIVKTKSSLISMSVSIFSTISQILKTKLYVFWTQTCKSWTKFFTWACYCSQVPGGNLQPTWYLASAAKVFTVLAWYWHNAGIRTAYHRRGSERQLGWKLSFGTGEVLNIGTLPALKSVLVQYWHYSEVGCLPTLGLRTGAPSKKKVQKFCRISAQCRIYTEKWTPNLLK